MTRQAEQKSSKPSEMPLIGRCFIIWGEDGFVQYQGIVRGEPVPGIFLVQFFEWIMGQLGNLTLIPISQMMDREYREPGGFVFFEDDEHLRNWMQYNAPKRPVETRPCSKTSTDVTDEELCALYPALVEAA